ncbi:MAG: DUF4097 family beta strand repeat-containing protein [Thermoanaerobaculia bacterium]
MHRITDRTQKTRVKAPRLAAALALALLATAPAAAAERLAVPVSDPNRPVTLRAGGLQAGFTVEGYDGQEVIVEMEAGDPAERDRHGRHGSDSEPPPGMRRLPNAGFGLTVEEKDNVVEVDLEGHNPARVHIRVPRNTSVRLKTVNGGDLVVRGVTGEHEIENVNGGITAEDVTGSLVAHTTNGAVTVTLSRIEPGKPMSFVSFNGDVDVTFPAGLAADLALRSDNGEVYTDFDVDLAATGPVKKEERKGGSYRVSLERTLEAQVGGGGAEITLRTFNGDVYVRQGR